MKQLPSFIKKNAAISIIAVLIILILLIRATLLHFGYSTPIPASNAKEKEYYEKRAIEWNEKQKKLNDIE